MIPKGLKDFPFPTAYHGNGVFAWDVTGTIKPTGMICRKHGGYSFLDSAELGVISGYGLVDGGLVAGMLKFECNVSVEFIYLMGCGI